MHPNYGHGHHIHVPQTMSSHPRQPEQRTAWSVWVAQRMSGFRPGSDEILVIFYVNFVMFRSRTDDWSMFMCVVHRELGIEAGVTMQPYPSGHLHSHLPHYHPPPRLHHFPIPFMVRETLSTLAYISINEKESLFYEVWLGLMVLAPYL